MRAYLAVMTVMLMAGYCLPTTASSQDVRYRYLRLPTLPDPEPQTEAQDINDGGVVCGLSATPPTHQAVIWDLAGGLRELGNLVEGRDDLGERAEAIHEFGEVVGVSLFPNGPYYDNQAFFWDADNGMVGLGDLPGANFYSWAKGINNFGDVVGYSSSTH